MSDFSTGDAVGSGFSLIAKRPLSVLAWSVVYLLLMLLPKLAHFLAIGPAWSGFMHSMLANAASGGQPDLAEIQAFQGQMMQWSALGWLATGLQLLGWGVLSAAIYRALLEPEKKGWASLRLGVQELWLALLALVSVIILVIAGIVIAVAAGVLIAIVALIGSQLVRPWGPLLDVVLITALSVGAIGAFLWVCVRLSLAGPLTYTEKQFRLFESWNLTKGHAWKLFGLAVLLTLIVIALGCVVGGVEAAVVFSTLGSVFAHGFDVSKLAEMFAKPDWWRPFAPWFVAAVLVRSILGAAFMAILVAPWAVAFKEISKGAKPEHPPVF
jgi:hypothetical protein